jgi:hypothetical protein
MGCDIHTFIEYKRPGTNEWIHYNVDEGRMGDRNHSRFGVLAGIQVYDIDPIDEPRGMPNDTANFIMDKYNIWSHIAHSASYFTLAELLEALPNYNNTDVKGYNPLTSFVEAFQSHANTIFKPMSLFHKDPATHYSDHIRVVFWFDN